MADMALRKLLTVICQLLMRYAPKFFTRQHPVHGGGVFDEDMISGKVKS